MKTILCYLRWILPVLFCLLGLGFLAFPGYSFSAWICFGAACVIACYYLLYDLRRKKLFRILTGVLTGLLCIGLILAVITGCFVANAAQGNPDVSCQYLIVLGAGVNGTQPSLILSERIQQAYTYLMEHPDVCCIVSGGQGPGEAISEAQCMFDRLTKMGISPDRILLEDQSTSTRENIRYSLDLIEQQFGSRPDTAAVVSNEFHLFRAGLFAQEQDLHMVGIPAQTTWVSLRINYFLREIVAIWYYILLGG